MCLLGVTCLQAEEKHFHGLFETWLRANWNSGDGCVAAVTPQYWWRLSLCPYLTLFHWLFGIISQNLFSAARICAENVTLWLLSRILIGVLFYYNIINTALQTRRWRVWFPVGPLAFLIYLILPAALRPWGSTRSRIEMSISNVSWGVQVACAQGWQPYHFHVPNVYKVWEPQPPGGLRACPGQ
jgi:hypothetical protein